MSPNLPNNTGHSSPDTNINGYTSRFPSPQENVSTRNSNDPAGAGASGGSSNDPARAGASGSGSCVGGISSHQQDNKGHESESTSANTNNPSIEAKESVSSEDAMKLYEQVKASIQLPIQGTGTAWSSTASPTFPENSNKSNADADADNDADADPDPDPAPAHPRSPTKSSESARHINFPTYETYRGGPRKAETFIALREMIATSAEDELEKIWVHVQDYLTVGSKIEITPQVQALVIEDILVQTETQKAKWSTTMDWRPSTTLHTIKGRLG